MGLGSRTVGKVSEVHKPWETSPGTWPRTGGQYVQTSGQLAPDPDVALSLAQWKMTPVGGLRSSCVQEGSETKFKSDNWGHAREVGQM